MRKLKQWITKLSKTKAQYNLDRQTYLSSGKLSKYEYLTGKDALPEKDLLEKAASMKRYE